MKAVYLSSIVLITLSYISCAQENKIKVGGDCEICEAIYESPVPFDQLNAADTLPDFNDDGPRLKIEGTVFKKDKRTPAKDVVIYIYHTDQTGVYPKKGKEKGFATQHGFLRGWIKTDKEGRYAFYTLRPASYPNSTEPAHIHAVVKESDKNEYWIDDYIFSDDPFLSAVKDRLQKRGGSGILNLEKTDDAYFSTRRDIILGENIPNYP